MLDEESVRAFLSFFDLFVAPEPSAGGGGGGGGHGGAGGSGARHAHRRTVATPLPATLFEYSMLVPVPRGARAPGATAAGAGAAAGGGPSALVSSRELGGGEEGGAVGGGAMGGGAMGGGAATGGSSSPGAWSKLFVEVLDISAIALRATLKRAPSAAQDLSLNPFYALFNLLTTALISIDDAPIKLHRLARHSFFVTPPDLGTLAALHYRAEGLRAVLMVFLSLDCIGKPYESLMDLAGAVHALLRPFSLLRRPHRFPRALLAGVAEALKIIVRVVFNAIAKILQVGTPRARHGAPAMARLLGLLVDAPPPTPSSPRPPLSASPTPSPTPSLTPSPTPSPTHAALIRPAHPLLRRRGPRASPSCAWTRPSRRGGCRSSSSGRHATRCRGSARGYSACATRSGRRRAASARRRRAAMAVAACAAPSPASCAHSSAWSSSRWWACSTSSRRRARASRTR